MPNISALRESKFLTRADCGAGILVTIHGCTEVNVAMEAQAPEMQWALNFKETPKPMILKSTNGQTIARILGSENTDDWLGKQIVLFDDPSVAFAGRQVGGIRVRAPKFKKVETQAAAPGQVAALGSGHFAQFQANPAPAPKPLPLAETMDNSEDIPF